MKKNLKTYHDAVHYLETLASTPHDTAYMKTHSANPQQYVERTREFVKLLGNPYRGIRFVHISGTAGKGTTTNYIHNILQSAGNTVGSFTQPYATTSIEKIKVNDLLLSPKEFVALVNKVQPAIEKMDTSYKYGRPSYFEIFFGMALLYFKQKKCNWAVLEVGCGGTYDAGMIIPKAICGNTNVGLDHMKLLGNTLSKIATEKAGIIRPHGHFFSTERRSKLISLFKKICTQKKATFHHIPAKKFDDANQKLATAITQHIGIADKHIHEGIQRTKLPCRFEIMQQHPLIILDGSHNPDKIRNVVHNLKKLTYDTLYTIFASSSNKDAQKMIKLLQPYTKQFIFTEFEAAAKNAYIAQQLASHTTHATIEPDAHKALKRTMQKIKKNDALLITGSFYMTGALREHWISEEYILTHRKTH